MSPTTTLFIPTAKEILQEHAPPPLPVYKIYFPLFAHDEARTNEVRQTHEGLLAHPQVILVDRPEVADLVVLCQNHLVNHNPFHVHFRALKEQYIEKMIMLDYGDHSGSLFDPQDFRWRLYFKRSCVDRATGRVINYHGRTVQPTAYCAVDDMCEAPTHDDDHNGNRRLDVSCLFDDSVIDSPYYQRARGALLQFAKRLAVRHPALVMQIGTVSECGTVGRARLNPSYKACLYDSKIVLHANPDHWEGDSRLWEAVASGALVFVDGLFAPIRHPLIDGKHLVFYDVSEAGFEILEAKIIHYLGNDVARRRIGAQGRASVLQHHRSINRVSEIIHELECTRPETSPYSSLSAAPASDLDVIVSIATGYKNPDQYRQFISTLRRTGATCPVFLGISAGPEYEPVKRYLLDNSINHFIVPPPEPPHKVVNDHRFAQYRQWLDRLEFRHALLMDFRGAYFQRDPFVDVDRFMRDCDLYLMSEFQPSERETADAIADEIILNSGAILGRKGALMKLLDALTEVTTRQKFEFADLGALNYLGHTGRLDRCGRIKIAPAGQSLVNNCGFTELDRPWRARAISADEKAIAFMPSTAVRRPEPYRDHEGWVLDDDGNLSYAVHQYDRFPQLQGLVARLSAHECPDRVFVNGTTRPYRGEKYTLSSREGLKPDAVERLIAMIQRLPCHKKPLLVLDGRFSRGFVFGYGTLNVDLLFNPEPFRRRFFQPSSGGRARARFLETWGYWIVVVDEQEIFVTAETSRSAVQTASGFAEASAQAEGWSSP